MSLHGLPSHIDLLVSDPSVSIPFYDAFFGALGWLRFRSDDGEFSGAAPRRATWFARYPGGALFGIEVRPADPEKCDVPLDRYRPGLHHMAFRAESPSAVDEIHARLVAAVVGAAGRVLDAPADYGGQRGYTPGYYAAFYADPDGLKLEVVYEPITNPESGGGR